MRLLIAVLSLNIETLSCRGSTCIGKVKSFRQAQADLDELECTLREARAPLHMRAKRPAEQAGFSC